jgi:guanylate kinase
VLVEVETVGAEKIKAEMPEAISIFILPPSVELLKKRLSGRATETPEQLEKRLDKAIEEMKKSVFYDYIVVNDSLEQAAEAFERIILSDRQKTERNINFINEVLKNA